MKQELFEQVNALKDTIREAEASIKQIGGVATGEHYEIFAGCLHNYIDQMEAAQKEIYQEAKRINEHSKRMMDAIERSIGHIKNFHQ